MDIFFQQLHGKRSNSSGSIDALQEWVKHSDNNFYKCEVLKKMLKFNCLFICVFQLIKKKLCFNTGTCFLIEYYKSFLFHKVWVLFKRKRKKKYFHCKNGPFYSHNYIHHHFLCILPLHGLISTDL